MNRIPLSRSNVVLLLVSLLVLCVLPLIAQPPSGRAPVSLENADISTAEGPDREVERQARATLERGRTWFRYDPFGSNLFFSDALGLDQLLATLSPRQALGLGVKVDVDRVPPSVQRALAEGRVDLDDPAITRFLLSRFAVVGVVAEVSDDGSQLGAVGITCAFCHSSVDDSFAPGVGRRLDGWANRDLDVGAILASLPNLQPIADLLGADVDTVQTVLRSWGPGKFDAHLNLDGKAFRPDGGSAAVLIPPAFGLAGVNLATYEGWGSVSYWNAFVAGHEMNGLGRFFDPRLDDAEKYPIAVAQGLADTREDPDLVTRRLADLHFYQLALQAPPAPADRFDADAAARGRTLFSGKADCARCHVPPLFTDPGFNLHTPDEIGIDSFQADRGPHGAYRTTPLRGLWTHTRGGFYHDGRFPTLANVIDHYDAHLDLELSIEEKADLAEYLMSL